MGKLQSGFQEFQAKVQEFRELEEPSQEDQDELQDAYDTFGECISEVESELEELKDEISTWADNIEEKFSGTDKYERLRECQQYLESAVEALQGIDLRDAEEVADLDLDSIESEVQTVEDEAGNAEFPGMFG